ncbi:hypothetical protein [Stappia sp. P2PMeth1]|uniref:hypothetical protein n=1 Tax=Stappia sp. P2PMeth1 TaxID=2003586 RepID=UPI001647CDCF|nr:hypothetical protein [Stappia sp. P2PMeth1]
MVEVLAAVGVIAIIVFFVRVLRRRGSRTLPGSIARERLLARYLGEDDFPSIKALFLQLNYDELEMISQAFHSFEVAIHRTGVDMRRDWFNQMALQGVEFPLRLRGEVCALELHELRLMREVLNHV